MYLYILRVWRFSSFASARSKWALFPSHAAIIFRRQSIANTLVGQRGATGSLPRSVSCFTCRTVSSSSSSTSFLPACSSTGELRVLDSVTENTSIRPVLIWCASMSIRKFKCDFHIENMDYSTLIILVT